MLNRVLIQRKRMYKRFTSGFLFIKSLPLRLPSEGYSNCTHPSYIGNFNTLIRSFAYSQVFISRVRKWKQNAVLQTGIILCLRRFIFPNNLLDIIIIISNIFSSLILIIYYSFSIYLNKIHIIINAVVAKCIMIAYCNDLYYKNVWTSSTVVNVSYK